MNNGVVKGLLIILIIIAAIVCFFAFNNKSTEENEKQTLESVETEIKQESLGLSENHKILVVYYSAQTHTRRVAERIASNLNADIFEIVPEEIYTEDDLDWSLSGSRCCKEYYNKDLREVPLKETAVPNWEEYDIVLIGYPIWWSIAAWPTNSFVKANDFANKTVIPFCTSYSSELGESGKLLESDANGGTWKTGYRFSQDVDLTEVDKWTDALK